MLTRRSVIASTVAAAMSRFVQPDAGLSDASLTVQLDASPLTAFMESLSKSLELRGEVSKGLLNLLEFPEQLFRLQPDHLAAGAYKLVVRLYPSDALLAAVAAG